MKGTLASKETLDKILDMHKKGSTNPEIAKEMKLHKSTISKYLIRMGIIRTQGSCVNLKMTEKHKKIMIEMKKNNAATKDIAKAVQLTTVTVMNFLKKEGFSFPRKQKSKAIEDRKNTIIEMAKNGLSNSEIAEKIGIKKIMVACVKSKARNREYYQNKNYYQAKSNLKTKAATLKEVAIKLYEEGYEKKTLSVEMIRKIENKALRKLGKYFKNNNIGV